MAKIGKSPAPTTEQHTECDGRPGALTATDSARKEYYCKLGWLWVTGAPSATLNGRSPSLRPTVHPRESSGARYSERDSPSF